MFFIFRFDSSMYRLIFRYFGDKYRKKFYGHKLPRNIKWMNNSAMKSLIQFNESFGMNYLPHNFEIDNLFGKHWKYLFWCSCEIFNRWFNQTSYVRKVPTAARFCADELSYNEDYLIASNFHQFDERNLLSVNSPQAKWNFKTYISV